MATATPVRRIVAGTLMAAGLATLGAGVASAATAEPAPAGFGVHQVGAQASEGGTSLGTYLHVKEMDGPAGGDDDLHRGGHGDPIGDAGQLKVYRP